MRDPKGRPRLVSRAPLPFSRRLVPSNGGEKGFACKILAGQEHCQACRSVAVPRSQCLLCVVRAAGGPCLRGKPVIDAQTLTDSAVAIAASYAAKAFGIKTGIRGRPMTQPLSTVPRCWLS